MSDTPVTGAMRSIYNSFLVACADAAGRPFRPRRDFSKMTEFDRKCLADLESRFLKHKYVDPRLYFANYLAYRGAKWLPLNQFLHPKALETYVRLVVARQVAAGEGGADPADGAALAAFKEGLAFLSAFCKERGARLRDYPSMENDHAAPYYLLHLKEGRISMLHLHFFSLALFDMQTDFCELVVPDFVERYLDAGDEFEASPALCSLRESFLKATRGESGGEPR